MTIKKLLLFLTKSGNAKHALRYHAIHLSSDSVNLSDDEIVLIPDRVLSRGF